MTENQPNRSLPLDIARERYELGSVSFRHALHAIVEADHTSLKRRDWSNTPEQLLLTTWIDDAKKNIHTPSGKNITASALGAIGLVADLSSVAVAYGIQMESPAILKFCQQADIFFNGIGLSKLIDVLAKAPQAVNTFAMTNSATANAILSFASYPDVANKLGLAVALPGVPAAIWALAKRKDIRIHNGKENIHRREKVGTILIGPISLMDTITEQSKAMKISRAKDVIIHTEPGEPASLGKSTERHFQITTEGLSSFAKYVSEHMITWGLTKTKRLVLAAFDENFSLFYGPDATRGLSSSNMTTILAALAPKQTREGLLSGKRTLIMVPYGAHIVGASISTHESLKAERQPEYLRNLKESGMEVTVTTPEEILYEQQLKGIIQKAKESGNSSVVLIGSDGEAETNMLKRFRSYLLKQDTELTIHIISDTSVNGEKVEIGMQSEEAKKLVREAGTIFVYADTDTKTTDATEGVLSLNVIKPEDIVQKVHSIIESQDAFANDTGGEPAHRICVFNEIAQYTKNWIDRQEK